MMLLDAGADVFKKGIVIVGVSPMSIAQDTAAHTLGDGSSKSGRRFQLVLQVHVKQKDGLPTICGSSSTETIFSLLIHRTNQISIGTKAIVGLDGKDLWDERINTMRPFGYSYRFQKASKRIEMRVVAHDDIIDTISTD